MRYFKLIYILLILFLNSCGNDAFNNNEIEISSEWETIRIKTEGNALALNDNPIIITRNNQEFYINYNQISHSLNFYNIDEKIFDKKIEFYKSGPDKIQSLAIYDIKGDTIVARSPQTIKLINFEGKMIDELSMPDLCSELENEYSLKEGGGIVITNLQNLYINQLNEIILRTYNKKDSYSNIYENPKFCIYNLNTNEGTAIDVIYPDELETKYYGDLEYPNIITKGDSILYNLPFKSSIYIYNRKSKKMEVKDFRAKNIASVVDGFSLSKKSNMMLKKTLFMGEKYYHINYDPYRDLFYILYSEKKIKDLPLKKHLIVFNNKLEKMGEVQITPGLSSNYVISKEGLLFRDVQDENFEYLELKLLIINLN